jgi:hypothetical protein
MDVTGIIMFPDILHGYNDFAESIPETNSFINR